MIMDEVKKIFTIDGKSTRSEYWAVNLVCYFLLVLSGIISALMMDFGFIGFVFVLPLMATVVDRKSTRLNSSHIPLSRMRSSA